MPEHKENWYNWYNLYKGTTDKVEPSEVSERQKVYPPTK